MRAILTTIAVAALMASAASIPARAERVALVIGNGDYEHIPDLANPANDARVIADTLRLTGFTVLEASDADRMGMEQAIRQFGAEARNAEAALFFYAGHGLQYGDRNYLLPVGATADEPADLRYEAVPLDLVMAELDEAAADVSLVILDACRDNPLVTRLADRATALGRSGETGRGLAVVRGAAGTLIAYATAPGDLALDGDGQNSPFTTALAEWLPQPGMEVGLMFRKVREAVIESTGGSQVPWVEEAILGEFYFVPQPDAVAGPAPEADTADQAETLFWTTVAESENSADFEAYLRRFPDGVFAELARNRIDEIEAVSPHTLRLPAVNADPVNGAVDVATDIGRIVFTFDQPMRMDSWSLVTVTGYPFPPPTTESARWRDAHTFELPLAALEPATSYGLRLTGAQPEGFRSALHDVPLPDTLIVFTTAIVAAGDDPAIPPVLTIDLDADLDDPEWAIEGLRLLEYPIAEGAGPTSDDVMAAVRDFQDEMGAEETGQLTPDQRVALATAAAEAAAAYAEAAAEIGRERAEAAREAAAADDAVEHREDGHFLYRGEDSGRATITVGVMEWLPGSDEAGERYEGEFSEGDGTGYGVAYWPDGSRYEGGFAGSSGEDFGVWIGPDGSRLAGQWRSDVFHGFGVGEAGNGGRQIGAWQESEPEGYGAYRHPDGRDDRGLWRAGELVERL